MQTTCFAHLISPDLITLTKLCGPHCAICTTLLLHNLSYVHISLSHTVQNTKAHSTEEILQDQRTVISGYK